MVTLTVELDKEKDLPVLQALLNRLELKYHIENEDYPLSEAELETIAKGMEDFKAGRVHTTVEVQARIKQKLADLRNG